MKIPIKNMPRLSLNDLLRRRKMTLKRFLDELGITTYEALCNRCSRMGVTPPEEQALLELMPAVPVNNPTEGIIVVEPIFVADEAPEAPDEEPELTFLPLIESTQKKSKKKKDEPRNDDA